MAWKGESRRHSLARRGIRTASGVPDYWEEREATRQRLKAEWIEDRRNYLKRFLPDWFVDSLEFQDCILDVIDKDEYIQPKDKTRINRLEESIGEDVIFVSSIPFDRGILYRKVKLIAVEGDDVIIEVDGKQVRTKAFNIRYVKRKRPRKPRRKRGIPIPKSSLPFKLVTDERDWEIYEARANWNGIPVIFWVFLKYHSRYGGWSVHYDIKGKKYTVSVPGYGKHVNTRKEAREIAHDIISKASIEDIEKLSDFQKESLKTER